jgi:hypothetical protein
MSLARYVLVVAAVLAGSALLFALASQGRVEAPSQRAAVLGALLAALNTVLAHALLCWARDRSLKAYLIAVLGGIAARMALVLGLLLLALATFEVQPLPIVLSLLCYFAVFQVLEFYSLRNTRPAALEAR